jgi:hypothetical protein
MQGALTVIPGRETELSKAAELTVQMKAKGRIADWQPAVSPRGLSIILKLDTSAQRRRAIIDEFEALGYDVVDER